MNNNKLTDSERALVDMFGEIWKVLKAADLELQTYRAAIVGFQKQNPGAVEALNDYVAVERQSSALQEKMSQKYAGVLESLLRKLPPHLPQRDLIADTLESFHQS